MVHSSDASAVRRACTGKTPAWLRWRDHPRGDVASGIVTTPTSRLATALADRYTIERELGAGGMATVFLARDIRHDRRVAIKVLRPDVAQRTGAERFLREIRTTANLQHPHIVPLFDSGEAEGSVYYVMPFIEGETLRDRLEREGQLPVREAVRIACEVADALDYAHRHGVVHRDVKPENVLLHDNRVLVADFGIALALARSTADPRLTETGMSVGTPHYMSPEQAMGEKHITARTDIFALGAMLYEMLAGEPPFTGESAQVIVAKMMTTAPTPIVTLRPTVPDHVAAAIDGALQRVPADRFDSARAFGQALETTSPTQSRTAAPHQAPGAASSASPRRPGAGVILATIAGLTAAGAIGVVWGRTHGTPTTGGSVSRAVIPLGRTQLLSTGTYPLTLSRDGRFLVYVGDDEGKSQLYLRPLADSIATVIAGTEHANNPFFSPDGGWVGFFADGKLRKVPRTGGAPITLTDAPAAIEGASWGSDGSILYAAGDSTLRRISSDGGSASVVTIATVNPVRAHALGILRWPSLLPDNARALVTTDSGVAVLDLKTGDARVIVRGRQATYVPSGHLVYDDNEGRMRAVAFDLRQGTIIGASVPVFEAFRGSGGGASYYAVSDNGTLMYMPGGFQRSLVRVDRVGRSTVLSAEARGYRFPAISPDGKQIAITVDPRPSQIWIVDAVSGHGAPLRIDGVHSIGPVWSADGTRLAFSRCCSGHVWTWATDGSELHQILSSPVALRTHSLSVNAWLRGGDLIGYETATKSWQSQGDIVSYHIGDSVPTRQLATPADERQPRPSPDERWLAYTSDASGTIEVYVRAMGTSRAPAVLVSSGGGVDPEWSRSGDELLYRNGTRIMSVGVRTRPDFAVLRAPQVLFSGPFDFSQDNNWSPAPDGTIIMVQADPTLARQLRVVFNWFDELKNIEPH